MTVFAIDPGNIESAYVEFVDGKVGARGKSTNGSLRGLLSIIPPGQDVVFAIEMVASYGMAVGKEVFETCVWIGRFTELLVQNGYHVEHVYRRDIKLHHCNSVRAKDANIIQALKDRFGDKGTKANPGFFYGVSADVWQAIALAVHVADRGHKNAA